MAEANLVGALLELEEGSVADGKVLSLVEPWVVDLKEVGVLMDLEVAVWEDPQAVS